MSDLVSGLDGFEPRNLHRLTRVGMRRQVVRNDDAMASSSFGQVLDQLYFSATD